MEKLAAKPLDQALEVLGKVSSSVPEAAVVLGSGVKVLEELDEAKSVSYEEIFGIAPGVVGHSGTLSLGKVNGKQVAVFRGRFHLYEGYDWQTVTLPARVLAAWGVKELFLTNAAGGINQSFKVGDLMLITSFRDHLNSKYKETGLLEQLAMQPVSCQNSLTARLLEAAKALYHEDGSFQPLQAGTYVGLLGPNYETLAEIEMLKYLKCDAVGMSTVPEILSCQGSSTQCAAISVITNVWSPEEAVGGHEEVLSAAKEASLRLDKLLRKVLNH